MQKLCKICHLIFLYKHPVCCAFESLKPRTGDAYRELKLTSKLAVMACIGMRGLKLTSKLAVMACREPEPDVQTLLSPSYATADARLHFFAAK